MASSNKISLSYTISEDEFVAALKEFWAYRGLGGWLLPVEIVAFGLLTLVLFYLTMWSWFLFAFITLFFVFLQFVRPLIWRRYYRKISKYSQPISASFQEEQVDVNSAEGSNIVPWTTFKRYCETENYFFLVITFNQHSIIPKTSFHSPEDMACFRDLTSRKLPKMKRRYT